MTINKLYVFDQVYVSEQQSTAIHNNFQFENVIESSIIFSLQMNVQFVNVFTLFNRINHNSIVTFFIISNVRIFAAVYSR